MILIRTDANEYLGIGHVMRCLSIAKAFSNIGEQTLFVTADHNADNLIKGNGFDCCCLDSKWNEPKTGELDEIVSKYNPIRLIIDSYYVSETYCSHINSLVSTAYIDDFNIYEFDVDFLINYNVYGTEKKYERYNAKKTELILGPTYAPLREEFEGAPKHPVKEVSDILILSGGSDPEGVCILIAEDVCPFFEDIMFHFVLGELNSKVNIIKRISESCNNIILHINEKNMSELMNKCDLAISAAGTTLYELCAMGLPTVMYVVADNQIMSAKEFASGRIMINAGDCRNNDGFSDEIKNIIKYLIVDKDKRCSLSQSMQKIVDGNGAKRIVERLL